MTTTTAERSGQSALGDRTVNRMGYGAMQLAGPPGRGGPMPPPPAGRSGQSALGDRTVNRMGYGAMQLAGPHVMGPPADRDAAVAVAPPAPGRRLGPGRTRAPQ